MVIILAILVFLFIAGMGYLNYMRGEANLTTRLLHNTAAVYMAEAAIEEAVVYVREQMNDEGQPVVAFSGPAGAVTMSWHDLLRQPAGQIGGAATAFDPGETNRMLAALYGDGNTCDMTIALENVEAFRDDPAPDPTEREKAGTLRFTANVRLGKAKKAVAVRKDFKVISLLPPTPMDKYSLWVWEGMPDTAYRAGASQVFNDPPGSTPLLSLPSVPVGDADFLAMNGSAPSAPSWHYTWLQNREVRYPLCAQKVSYVFDTMTHNGVTRDGWDLFKDYFFDNNTFRPRGTVAVNSSDPVTLQGRLEGKSRLVLFKSRITVDNLSFDQDAFIDLVSLKGTELKLKGYGSTPFTGNVSAPNAEVSSSPVKIRIEGSLYAKKLARAGEKTVDATGRQDDYLVTLGEQIVNWRMVTYHD